MDKGTPENLITELPPRRIGCLPTSGGFQITGDQWMRGDSILSLSNNRTLFGIPISVIAVIILSAMDTDEQARANNLFF